MSGREGSGHSSVGQREVGSLGQSAARGGSEVSGVSGEGKRWFIFEADVRSDMRSGGLVARESSRILTMQQELVLRLL